MCTAVFQHYNKQAETSLATRPFGHSRSGLEVQLQSSHYSETGQGQFDNHNDNGKHDNDNYHGDDNSQVDN